MTNKTYFNGGKSMSRLIEKELYRFFKKTTNPILSNNKEKMRLIRENITEQELEARTLTFRQRTKLYKLEKSIIQILEKNN